MFTYKKLALFLLMIAVGVPSVSAAGSVTASLIQGKTPTEAVQILAEQFDALTGRIEQVESTQAQTQADIEVLQDADQELIERQEVENEALRQQLAEQQAQIEIQAQQRENDEYCAELAQAGSKYLPTKQNIKELYERMVMQDSTSFEEDYEEHTQNGAKVLSREEYRSQWEDGRQQKEATLAQLKPHYDEYMLKCVE